MRSAAVLDGSSGLSVRPAVDADAPAMRRLTRAAFQRYVAVIGREPAPMRADHARLRPPACAWVVESAGALVGLLVCELAEEETRAAGVGEVRLYTDEAMSENVAYYPRRGYRETHRAGQGGYRRVFFAKSVTPPL